MKINVKTTIDGVQAIIRLSEISSSLNDATKEVKVVKSIMYEVYKKFWKKNQNATENQTLFNSKKKHSIDLKIYEAYALEKMIIYLIGSLENVQDVTLLDKIKNEINQKFA